MKNQTKLVKINIDEQGYTALLLILEKLKISEQDFFASIVKDYVYENMNILLK